MFFIMYEYAACLLAALIGGTLLFTAERDVRHALGGRWYYVAVVARTVAPGPNWLTGRWTAEPRVP